MGIKLLAAGAATLLMAFSASTVGAAEPYAYPACEKPVATGETGVTATIVVAAGQTFDGGNKRYRLLGESKAPVFELKNGASIRNVIIASTAGSGVACVGNCSINHVWWEGAAASAAVAKGPAGSAMNISCGSSASIVGQTVQHEGAGEVRIGRFFSAKAGALYRSCSDCAGKRGSRKVTIAEVITRDVPSIALVDSEAGDVATIRKLTLNNSNSTPTKVCQAYAGKSMPRVEFNTKSCNVSPSDVALIPPSQMAPATKTPIAAQTYSLLSGVEMTAEVTGSAEFFYGVHDEGWIMYWGWDGLNSVHLEYDDIGSVSFRGYIEYMTAESGFAGSEARQWTFPVRINYPTSIDYAWNQDPLFYYSWPGPGGISQVTRAKLLGQDGSGNYTVVLRDTGPL